MKIEKTIALTPRCITTAETDVNIPATRAVAVIRLNKFLFIEYESLIIRLLNLEKIFFSVHYLLEMDYQNSSNIQKVFVIFILIL